MRRLETDVSVDGSQQLYMDLPVEIGGQAPSFRRHLFLK